MKMKREKKMDNIFQSLKAQIRISMSLACASIGSKEGGQCNKISYHYQKMGIKRSNGVVELASTISISGKLDLTIETLTRIADQ